MVANRRLSLARLRDQRQAGQPGYGDTCPECGDAVGVFCTKRSGDYVIRYLGCKNCPYKPPNGKLVLFEPVKPKIP